MAGALPVGRRARTTRTTLSNSVRTTLLFGAHSWSRILVASVPRQFVSHIPLRSGTAQAPPITLICSALSQHIVMHIPASCQHKPQDRPSTCAFFLRFGAEAYARRATDKHTGINPSKDHRRGLRLLREPIGLHTPLLTEPGRPARDPLGLRAPCYRSSCRGSFVVVLPGKEQAVLVECLDFLAWRFFSSTRNWVSETYVDPSCTSDKLLCSLSAENSTATSTNLTQPGPLSYLPRSTAFPCVT